MSKTALLALALCLPLTLQAQTIPIKTVPVAEGDQFLIFPSRNLSMGGVSLALDDPLLDPFVNPAKGAALQGFQVTGAPMLYSFGAEGNDVSGRTLPFGALYRQGQTFIGGLVAWQELVVPRQQQWFIDACPTCDDFAPFEESSFANDNLYATGLLGTQIEGTNLSVGLNLFGARLNGVEGVQHLYQNGDEVDQYGTMGRVTAGLYHRADAGHAAELTLTHHRFSMTHTMLRWDPATQDVRDHEELDQTRGWAASAGYVRQLEGVRLGLQLTGDWKYHPKIPNYDLMRIPRDPGHSSAYNVGVGLAREVGPVALGIDLIYEPIWSHTWADALTDTPTAEGGTVRAGEMTVENDFRFHNVRLRMGLRRTGERFEFGLGLNSHRISYHLDQQNYVEVFTRAQRESWTEHVASLGLGLLFPEFEVRYLGRLKLGTGIPSVAWGGGWARTADVAFASADFLVAPGGALSLFETNVVTHQISVVVPVR